MTHSSAPGASRSTCSGDSVEDPLPSRQRWNPGRISHIPGYGHQRGLLAYNRDNHLRLIRTVFESFDNGILNFNFGATGGANVARIGNGNVSLVVNGLIGDGNKIACPIGGPVCDEKPACSGLKYRHTQDVANTKTQIGWSTPITKFADEPRRSPRQDFRHPRGDFDGNVGNAPVRVPDAILTSQPGVHCLSNLPIRQSATPKPKRAAECFLQAPFQPRRPAFPTNYTPKSAKRQTL